MPAEEPYVAFACVCVYSAQTRGAERLRYYCTVPPSLFFFSVSRGVCLDFIGYADAAVVAWMPVS